MDAHVFIGVYFITYQEKGVEKDDTLHWAKTVYLVHAPSTLSFKINHQPPNSPLVGQVQGLWAGSLSLVRRKRTA